MLRLLLLREFRIQACNRYSFSESGQKLSQKNLLGNGGFSSVSHKLWKTNRNRFQDHIAYPDPEPCFNCGFKVFPDCSGNVLIYIFLQIQVVGIVNLGVPAVLDKWSDILDSGRKLQVDTIKPCFERNLLSTSRISWISCTCLLVLVLEFSFIRGPQ